MIGYSSNSQAVAATAPHGGRTGTRNPVTLREATAILAGGEDCEKRAIRKAIDVDADTAGATWQALAVADMICILEAGRIGRGWIDVADCVAAGWPNAAVVRLAPQALLLVGNGEMTDVPPFERTAPSRYGGRRVPQPSAGRPGA